MSDASDFEAFAERCQRDLADRQADLVELILYDIVGNDGRTLALGDDGEVCARARIVPIGSFAHRSSSWRWAWANPESTAGGLAAAVRVHERPEVRHQPAFQAVDAFRADEATAWCFAAIGCHVANGQGVYRWASDAVDWFFAITDITRLEDNEAMTQRAARRIEADLRGAPSARRATLLRQHFPDLRIDLSGADLRGAPKPWQGDLHAQILFDHGRLDTHAARDLAGANFSHTRLDGAILRGLDLCGARFEGAVLVEADLAGARLDGANFRGAFLNGTNFSGATVGTADFAGAEFSRTLLNGVDLSAAQGLDLIHHLTPSEISFSTLVASRFELEPAFLRAAGVSRGLIEDLDRGQRFQNTWQTCFLSYSSKDAAFAELLYAALQEAGVRVFWDRFDVLPGELLEQQIAEAIREHDRLILVLSPHSMASPWVEKELRLAWHRKRESLLPIRLCPIEAIEAWTANSPSLPDLAAIFPMQDFSDWQDDAVFALGVDKVLRALGSGVHAAELRSEIGGDPKRHGDGA
ncbi:MAG: toll/interleukin-1 receptor domain-containing protein [Rhodocyclaceae bacterium]|nr:toll/interleukin-1 receptor domain-containing protein [Rhodocyclaceae bacterium]